jgi:2-oxoglutarate ferredoxin oxidoreductase subunit alpha
MAEFCGLGYYAEIPGVIINVQRTGPSTGLPTRTQQSDLLSAAFLSHGDTKHPILLPGSVKECFELTQAAFDLAERADSGLCAHRYRFRHEQLDVGTVRLSRQAPGSRQDSYRRRSGTAGQLCPLPRRGRRRRWLAHAARNAASQRLVLYPRLRTQRRSQIHRGPGGVSGVDGPAGAEVREDACAASRSSCGQERKPRRLVAWPTVPPIAPSPRASTRSSSATGKTWIICASGPWPFAHEIHDFVASHDRIYVVEQSRDAQLASLLKLDLPAAQVTKLRSILHYNGLPVDAEFITAQFALQEGL